MKTTPKIDATIELIDKLDKWGAMAAQGTNPNANFASMEIMAVCLNVIEEKFGDHVSTLVLAAALIQNLERAVAIIATESVSANDLN